MNSFRYARAQQVDEAIATASRDGSAAYVAGGTTILDLMKETVVRPSLLIDINALPHAQIERCSDAVAIGALARMSDVADHPAVALHAPVIVEALRQSASPQLRNMATIGGNLLQRTRCAYYRDVATPCNKREPGQGCSALHGENRRHAVLGASEHCISVHASDLAVALVALDASVLIAGMDGERQVNVVDFYRLPGSTPHLETVLQHGELIIGVSVPITPAAARSTYLKVRDRASFDFALVSVAAALEIVDGRVRDARVALGGVAPVPWRARDAESALIGAAAGEAAYRHAAQAALRNAQGRGQNDFKIPLAKNAIVRALLALSERS